MGEIRCLECFELTRTFELLDMTSLESIIDYVDELETLVGKNDFESYLINGDLICSHCGGDIGPDDYYIPEETGDLFVKKVCKLIAEKVSNRIHFCSKCEVVRELNLANEISFKEFGKYKYSEGQTITDFLIENSVPEQYIKYVLNYLNCCGCGFGFDEYKNKYVKGNFDESFRVYQEDDIFDSLDIDLEEWSRFAEDYNILIRSFELNNFVGYLKSNPLLGYKHPIGLKIYQLLEKMFLNKDYIILDNSKLYRGRTREKEAKKFKPKQMWNPPFGYSTHGRYNFVGGSVLYCSDSKEFIPYEVNYTNSQNLDLATIKVKKPLKILDFSNLIGDFGKYLSQVPSGNTLLKFEYLLTNYISECCREIGFNGVKYKGVKEGSYFNYALINFTRGDDLQIMSVETIPVKITYSFTIGSPT